MDINDRPGCPQLRTSGLALLFATALALRVTGLVSFANPDENWSASVRVLAGELNGGTSQTLPLVNYLNAASFVPLYGIGRLIGVWNSTADFRAQYFHDRTPFIFAGRLVAAALGAFTPVLAALIAGRLGLGRRSCWVVGAMVALFPENVWLAHMAKTDSGVAFGLMLLVWSILRKVDHPGSRSADVLVGLALAIAVSFKQTAILLSPPLLLGLVILLRRDAGLPWSGIARGLLVSLGACVLACIPMNLGVLLDIRNFLEWQRFLLISVESGRSASAYQIVEAAVRTLKGSTLGLTTVGFLVWLLAPVVRRDPRFLVIWAAPAFAYVAINVASGPLAHPRYYFPFNQIAFTAACLAALSMVERNGAWRPVGRLATAAVFGCAVFGSYEVVRQAMATPMQARCPEVIRSIADPDKDRILSADLYMLGLPISDAASREERERDDRLASKYGVKLPQRPPERAREDVAASRGYYARRIPYDLGGDPNRDSSLSARSKKVMAYWWPIQQEEWDLDYWTTRGYRIFMLIEGGGFTGTGLAMYDEPLFHSFHAQIEKRCELVATLPTSRYLFGERTVRIFRLPRDAAAPRPSP